MKYVISVIDDTTRSPHTPEEIKSIDDFNDQLVSDGRRIFAGGLDSPSAAVVIDNRGGSNLSVDGPFIESLEFFSGFWIVEADDIDMARELAAEGSRCCNRKVELRPILN